MKRAREKVGSPLDERVGGPCVGPVDDCRKMPRTDARVEGGAPSALFTRPAENPLAGGWAAKQSRPQNHFDHQRRVMPRARWSLAVGAMLCSLQVTIGVWTSIVTLMFVVMLGTMIELELPGVLRDARVASTCFVLLSSV
jgi:hypothetical protein